MALWLWLALWLFDANNIAVPLVWQDAVVECCWWMLAEHFVIDAKKFEIATHDIAIHVYRMSLLVIAWYIRVPGRRKPFHNTLFQYISLFIFSSPFPGLGSSEQGCQHNGPGRAMVYRQGPLGIPWSFLQTVWRKRNQQGPSLPRCFFCKSWISENLPTLRSQSSVIWREKWWALRHNHQERLSGSCGSRSSESRLRTMYLDLFWGFSSGSIKPVLSNYSHAFMEWMSATSGHNDP